MMEIETMHAIALTGTFILGVLSIPIVIFRLAVEESDTERRINRRGKDG